MRFKSSTIGLFIFGVFLSSCGEINTKKIIGNGEMKTTTISTSDYDIINASGNLYINLVRGNEGKIKISAEENLIEYIQVFVENSQLTIKVKKGYNLSPSVRSKISITVPFEQINDIMLSGSGGINTTDTIQTNRFSVSIAGSYDANLNVFSETVTSSIAGSGGLSLFGKTSRFEVSVSGSGEVSAFELTANNANVSISGSGSIDLFVTDSLEASIAGSGNILYKGNPKNINKNIVGSGKVSSQ